MYIDEEHSLFLLQRLSSLRHTKELCDIELVVGRTSLFAHKVVLAAVSDYFRAMFSSKMEETTQRSIYLHDLDEKAVSCLLDYAYTGHITFSVHNVQTLLASANMLGVTKVVEVCCEFLEEKLHVSNCLSFLQFADRHSLVSLKEACVRCACDNFSELTTYEEYLCQDSGTIKILLSHNDLNVDHEEDVFVFLEQWLSYAEDERIDDFYELLEQIRFPHLTSKFIQHLKTHAAMSSPLAYHFQLKLNSLAQLKENPFRLLDEDLENFPSTRRSSNDIIICGGTEGLYEPLDSCCIYNCKTGLFTEATPLPAPRFNAAAAYHNGEVYLLGGMCCAQQQQQQDTSTATTTGRTCTSTVLRYTMKTNTWATITPMTKQRSYLSVVVHGGSIYAIGGYDSTSCLKSMERYDPRTETWEEEADMQYSRTSFAAITFEDYIYVLGGQGTVSHLCTVERYDVNKKRWQMMPAMSTKRINFGAAQIHGFIYVCGGHDGQDYLRSMERFDPFTSEWAVVAPMATPRTGLGLAVVHNEIYVIGGHNGTQYLKSCCRYNPVKDTWTDTADMVHARCYMAVADAWL